MLILDTQAWVWWTTGDRRLVARARRRITAEAGLAISSLSVMEAAYAVKRGRLVLNIAFDDWLTLALRSGRVSVTRFDPVAATLAGSLDWDHCDPMDRGIVATAIAAGAALVTSDRRIRDSGLVDVVWS
ncbi:MAG: PIN domain-containing protein [Planctomycetota bacterium]